MALNSQRRSQESISGLSKDFSEVVNANRRSIYCSEDDNSSNERAQQEQSSSRPKLKASLLKKDRSKRFQKGSALGFGAMLNTAS